VVQNEPLESLDDLRDVPDDEFAGYEDGSDDGYEADVDEIEGYEPEAYAMGAYQPPPEPWYRNPQASVAVGAIALAVVALVVSTVLLVFRPPRDEPSTAVEPAQPSGTPTTTARAPTLASPPPSPPIAPPGSPPPPESPTQVSAVPVIVNNPPVQREPTKPPEIGVTRTPATRQPISVAPSARAPHPH
jgi:hypothetical protein